LAHPVAPSQSRDAILAVAALAMAPAVGLGLGRFAYALVLPDMQAAFGWSYGEAGLPNTMNAFGYFLGAAAAGRIAARAGSLRLVVVSTIFVALSTALSAAAWDLTSLSVLRFAAGFAAALGLVAAGAVAISLAERAGRHGSLVVALLYAGPPTGIIVSALVAPLALEAGGLADWRAAWAALGAASAVLLLAFLAPPFRRAGGVALKAAGGHAPLRPMLPVLVGYGIFGAGYIAYMTFMIAFLRQDGARPAEEALFWCVLGAGGLASPWISSWALSRLRGGQGLAVTMAVTLLGALLPLAFRSFAAELASAAIFGLGMFAVTAATTMFVRASLPAAAWASGVGAMTVAFSIGQSVGPVLIGAVTDRAGGLDAGLALGAALLALAAIIAANQRNRAPSSVAPTVPMPDDPAAERPL
jgi:predicted MFS family arabinose efflux permease